MTNGEKYKTSNERAEALLAWCKVRDKRKCQKMRDGYCFNCAMKWIDLESEEEKYETIDDVIADMGKAVEMMRKKESEGATLLDLSVILDKFLNRIIAAHNRVAKKCREVK